MQMSSSKKSSKNIAKLFTAAFPRNISSADLFSIKFDWIQDKKCERKVNKNYFKSELRNF